MIAFVRAAPAAGLLIAAAVLYGCGGSSGGGTPSANMPGSTEMPSAPDLLAEFGLDDLGEWEFVLDAFGDAAGVEHTTHGLNAHYDSNFNPVITASSPVDQPTVTGTWEGQWAGVHEGEVADSGRAEIGVVVSGSNVQATLTYFDVMQVGAVTAAPATVVDGRFSPAATIMVGGSSLTYSGEGQFGGAGQAGVVGYIDAPDLSFLSVFYGDRN